MKTHTPRRNTQRKAHDMINLLGDSMVEFAYYRPSATKVSLAGNFNHGSTCSQPMLRDVDGWWRVRMKLEPGEYRFQYHVDGAMWEADFAAFGVEMNQDGRWTSILWIPPADQTHHHRPAAA